MRRQSRNIRRIAATVLVLVASLVVCHAATLTDSSRWTFEDYTNFLGELIRAFQIYGLAALGIGAVLTLILASVPVRRPAAAEEPEEDLLAEVTEEESVAS